MKIWPTDSLTNSVTRSPIEQSWTAKEIDEYKSASHQVELKADSVLGLRGTGTATFWFLIDLNFMFSTLYSSNVWYSHCTYCLVREASFWNVLFPYGHYPLGRGGLCKGMLGWLRALFCTSKWAMSIDDNWYLVSPHASLYCVQWLSCPPISFDFKKGKKWRVICW